MIIMACNGKGQRREREFLEKLTKDGFVAHRIAGSGKGEDAICDLIAIKEGIPHFVEVKSRKKVFYTKEHLPQLEAMKKAALECKAKPMLAVKLNYKEWQVFDITNDIPSKVY